MARAHRPLLRGVTQLCAQEWQRPAGLGSQGLGGGWGSSPELPGRCAGQPQDGESDLKSQRGWGRARVQEGTMREACQAWRWVSKAEGWDSCARLGCGREGRQEQEAKEASPQTFVDSLCKGGQELAWAPRDTSVCPGSIGSLSTAKVSSPIISWATPGGTASRVSPAL